MYVLYICLHARVVKMAIIPSAAKEPFRRRRLHRSSEPSYRYSRLDGFMFIVSSFHDLIVYRKTSRRPHTTQYPTHASHPMYSTLSDRPILHAACPLFFPRTRPSYFSTSAPALPILNCTSSGGPFFLTSYIPGTLAGT